MAAVGSQNEQEMDRADKGRADTKNSQLIDDEKGEIEQESKIQEEKKRKERVFDNGKKDLFICKLKESLKATRRQPKQSTFDIDILTKSDAEDWSFFFGKKFSSPFDDDFEVHNLCQKKVIWRQKFFKYEEVQHLFPINVFERKVGQQGCFILFNQTTTQEPFEVALHGTRVYEFESEDAWGTKPILSSILFYERFFLCVKYRAIFMNNEIAKGFQ
jgi:hypothetical protein